MSNSAITIVPGFHMNFNHSWRGDRNDRSGFGLDSIVVEGILDILDRAEEQGLPSRGTWDFDNYWTIEHIIKTYAPELLERIVRRVKDGRDEVILDAWNNGLYGAMSEREFRETLRRTISNPGGSGVLDVFGKYTPVIRTQETTFTQGNIELLLEQGVEAIALYYSSVPFDSIRNFVRRLTPNEMFNPLWFNSTVSGARMKMLPMHSQGDILNNGFSIKAWLKKIRAKQESGAIPGNALLYINMDADAELWTGLNLPAPLNKLPGSRGLDEFIEAASELEYAKFGSLAEYLSENEPAGEITVRQDLADGSFTGYNSWTEKEENHRLWRMSQRARRHARIAESAIEEKGAAAPDGEAERVKTLLEGETGYFENKLLLLSTTHFGMHAPAVHEERVQIGFNLAANAFESAREAARIATTNLVSPVDAGGAFFRFFVLDHKRRSNAASRAEGARCLMRAPFGPLNCGVPPSGAALYDEGGNPVVFDIFGAKTDDSGNLSEGVICFAHASGRRAVRAYTLGPSRISGGAAAVKVSTSELTNGLVTLRLDSRGRVCSLEMNGSEFSTQQLFSTGATYKAEKRAKYFTPRSWHVAGSGVGPAGSMAWLELESRVVVFREGKNYPIKSKLRLSLFEGLPYLFADSETIYPETPREGKETSVATGSDRTFDTAWRETMPLQVAPKLKCSASVHPRIWKKNYLGVMDYYDINYGDIDPANKEADSCNNHVTDGWIALSGGGAGILISCDSTINSSPAYCPARTRASETGVRALLNPFGTYYGKQFSHLHEGFNIGAAAMKLFAPHLRSVAPSYNGKTIHIRMMLSPYEGDAPPDDIALDADSFSMPPAVIAQTPAGDFKLLEDPVEEEELRSASRDFCLDEVRNWKYRDFLEHRNKGIPPGVPKEKGGMQSSKLIKIIADGIRNWS